MRRSKSNYLSGEIAIPTASLPDIIFMLLFFFMVTTVLKEKKDMVKFLIPDALQIKKIDRKSTVSEIIIGIPQQQKLYGAEPVIQIDGRLIKLGEITQYIEEKKGMLSEIDRNKFIVLLKVDKNVEMGIVSDVQQELKKGNTRKIIYATLEKKNKKSQL